MSKLEKGISLGGGQDQPSPDAPGSLVEQRSQDFSYSLCPRGLVPLCSAQLVQLNRAAAGLK